MFSAIKQFFTGEHDTAFYVRLAVYGIIILYMLVLGMSDVLRLSLKRIWAISGVCFSESIRRRVLWIIPLALLGLVIVVQLQQSWDPQEDIRQATKFCLFTTGLVVVTSTIILACSNLPREIESRVIFTVVTKPTTRLEIIFGKITGFARMSATILLIMGVFTFTYLHVRAWSLQRDLTERLRSGQVESVSKPTFQHYVEAGLLNAKSLAGAQSMNVFQQAPAPGSNRRYPSAEGGVILVPFRLPADAWAIADPEATTFKGPGMTVSIRVGYDSIPPKITPGKPTPVWSQPKVSFSVYDPGQNSALATEIKGVPVDIPSPDGSKSVSIDIAPNYVYTLTKFPFFYIAVTFAGGDGKLWIDDDPQNPPVLLSVPVTNQPTPSIVKPSDPYDVARLGPLIFTAREGVTGQQVKGDPAGDSQVCVLHFPNLTVSPAEGDRVPIEFKLGVEKSGEAGDADVPTEASLRIFNVKTATESDAVIVTPENNRWFYTSVPADWIKGGDFDIRLRCLSDGQWLNVKRSSLAIVKADHNFAWNLVKSTFILWMLSVLVTSIAVCCSTFLSWPIAVVLTLVILFAHWGVEQLGDSASAGIGHQFVTEFGVTDPAKMHVLSDSVEALNKVLKQVSSVLPDIDQFSATEEIDHGINITSASISAGAIVLVAFGLPFSILAYIRLKNMEVAP